MLQPESDEALAMIPLTKLDNTKILLSLDNVKYIESTPDTLVFFTNGESVIVRESLDDLLNRVVEFKSKVLNQSQYK